MIKVEGHKNLFRDENSGAIVNCDDVAYDNYVRSLKTSEKKKNEIDQMKSDIQDIKDALKDLKEGINLVINSK
tara:strand:+ start:3141 stop:3359 length:219 start_codon:yes stop_codon:yes gene_type:complete